jgi:lycopene beta-cyclase
MPDCYDYLITGSGAAGLSLAYHLNQSGLTDKRILLLDRAPKTGNDRTWCFWEAQPGPFESLVFRVWDRISIYSHDFSAKLEIRPYRYKMIRSADFYRHMEDWLMAQPNIERAWDEVLSVESAADHAVARTRGGGVYRGSWAFNSILFTPPAAQPAYHFLLQHFLGWVIRAPRSAFEPAVATLMDFRVDQVGDTRFAYVLPFDAQTALVEYTVFSPALLAHDEYVRPLARYITAQLGIADFEVQHEEFGVIPMTDIPFSGCYGPRVINIGTAGGDTKPSTGYTFQRIQRRTRRIAWSLRTNGVPPPEPSPISTRHALLDSVLLNVLSHGRLPGWRVFVDLFARNPPQRVLRFLDEDTTLREDLHVMCSVDLRAFLVATADVLRRRLLSAISMRLRPSQSQ